MRANYKLQRIHIENSLMAGVLVALNETQSHYFLTVLRKDDGEEVLAFNGRDGEWLCALRKVGKKQASLIPLNQVRPQSEPGQLRFLFAPLKIGRLDFLVEKATEMGVATIEPVITTFTQNRNVSTEKLERWSMEAAEQCGVLAVPKITAPRTLDLILSDWDANIRLIFCDEDSPFDNPLEALRGIRRGALAVLVGPEGGFSDEERARLRALPFVTAIPLGPRILRADTAAIAALTLVQATIGDW